MTITSTMTLLTTQRRRPRRKKRPGVGTILAFSWIILLTLLALLAPILPLAPYGESDFGAVRQPPHFGWPDPLGTDALGRSMLSRLIYGAQVSLAVGVLSVAIGVVIGVTLGIIAAYFRGWLDGVINIVTDTLLSVPPLVLLLTLVMVLTPSIENLVIGLALLGLPTFIRITRANALSIAERDYVSAAVTIGASRFRILRREILPNVMMPPLVYGVEIIGVFIVAEASLSFLGLGVPPPQPSWGGMIADAVPDMQTAPYLMLLPVIVMFLTVLSFKVAGDFLRARMNVREV